MKRPESPALTSARRGNPGSSTITVKRIRPPLKWAGGKYRLLDDILKNLPAGPRLIEPFVGSGAVFLNSDYPRYAVNDINRDLTSLYERLKQDSERFIRDAGTLFTPDNNNSDAYYRLRDEFNQTTDRRRKSSLFLYLNKFGYNGLMRYNSTGEFNVPFGRYKRPYFPAKELKLLAAKLATATITNGDFEAVMREARPGEVIYCDPPYVPLSATAYFTAYTAGIFTEQEQRRLARVAAEVASQGVTVMISNHCTELTEKEIYRDARIIKLQVRRLISCNGAKREHTMELLAIYPAAH